ncbi:hypothetical protein NQZ68_036355 [Dissostichus eleginoides]|nr:hypothetical protein NQZ68_036355 [Dissostichus eleginoides]
MGGVGDREAQREVSVLGRDEAPKVIFKRKTPLSVLRSQTHSQRHGNKSNSRLCDSLKVTSAARFQTGTGLVGSGPPVRQPLWWVSLSSRAITLHLMHVGNARKHHTWVDSSPLCHPQYSAKGQAKLCPGTPPR